MLKDFIFQYIVLVRVAYDSSSKHLKAVTAIDFFESFNWIYQRSHSTLNENIPLGYYNN